MIPSPLIPILLYLAKMTAVSALFFIYYRIFLRHSPRHTYNRCYLLGTMTLALLIPLLRLPLPAAWAAAIHPADLFFQPIPAAPAAITNAKTGPSTAAWLMGNQLNVYCLLVYSGIACLFLWPTLRSLQHLHRLCRTYTPERCPGYRLYRTRETGTPFSFFNHLFWNEAIPLDTAKGQAILQHELVHIRQRHSLDLLCFETIRALAWCNPFFYLQLRELKLVHEFLADREALQVVTPQPGGLSRTDYAEWLVLEAAGSARPSTHSFYSHHLQIRITMILQTSRPRGLLRQAAVLPLTILLCCAFARTPSRHQVTPGRALMHFYLRHLRYPGAALQQGLEQTVSFSLRIGEHNQLLEFKPIPTMAGQTDSNTGIVTVKARAIQGIKIGSPGADKKDVFEEELRTVSEGIPTDTTAAYPPGEYTFTIVFRLEKSAQ